MPTLEEQAIQAALSGSWDRAIVLNHQIIAKHPLNIDALSRLAYALSQSGKFKKACTIYETILSKEPYHPIAQKNLLKCRQYDKENDGTIRPNNSKTRISPNLFVADAQRTRIVQLVNLAKRTVVKNVSVGEAVFPYRKGFEMHIKTETNEYLGTLPDDVGRNLIRSLKEDLICECFVKDLSESDLTIFIKWHD